MITKFVEIFDANREKLHSIFREKHPDNYQVIVKTVIQMVHEELVKEEKAYADDAPDPERIVQIDHGDYQGTMLYVIGAIGYQPCNYWFVKVGYGSCSGCDTLQAISDYSEEPPTEEQANEYLTLALHIVQGLRPMQDDGEYNVV
jgi:hypothetical protein